jgi:hypothetical protein
MTWHARVFGDETLAPGGGDLLAIESAAPPWWDLVRAYHRLDEARGEVRGGRFVTGSGGRARRRVGRGIA